jgi:hypothetical protein
VLVKGHTSEMVITGDVTVIEAFVPAGGEIVVRDGFVALKDRLVTTGFAFLTIEQEPIFPLAFVLMRRRSL